MIAAWVTLLALLAAGQVDVRSSTDCPSAQAIAARLAPLLPGLSGRDLADVRRLGGHADGTADAHIALVHVALFDEGRVLIGERRVSLRGSCEQMAEAVAAILAAWTSNPGPSVASVTGAAARQGAAESTPVRAPSRFEVQAGAGVGAHVVGGTALGGSLELRFGPAASHWRWRLAFAAQTTRQVELPAEPAPGHVDWQHTQVALGLGWGSLGPGWRLAIDGGLVAGFATVSGHGFDTDRRARSFEHGAGLGVRGGRSWGRFTLWLEARPTLWLKRHEVRVTGSPAASQDLPVVDVAALVGVSVSTLP